MGSHFLLQGIFLTQGLNPVLLRCRQILYHPSHEAAEKKDRVDSRYPPERWPAEGEQAATEN